MNINPTTHDNLSAALLSRAKHGSVIIGLDEIDLAQLGITQSTHVSAAFAAHGFATADLTAHALATADIATSTATAHDPVTADFATADLTAHDPVTADFATADPAAHALATADIATSTTTAHEPATADIATSTTTAHGPATADFATADPAAHALATADIATSTATAHDPATASPYTARRLRLTQRDGFALRKAASRQTVRAVRMFRRKTPVWGFFDSLLHSLMGVQFYTHFQNESQIFGRRKRIYPARTHVLPSSAVC